ncbi:hypothetical protein [Treponema sp.]|uniref:hypothetical protein n=1 Tax=Treponema sp. TaxID=166 RepID=UPI0025EE7D15|nr:hypothetical protein [Treponema sp.]MCR5217154.1 hypothetical protein [Treponema sp.]
MKVEVKELKVLLDYVENKISRLETSGIASSAELFDLNIVDSNLTLLLSTIGDAKEYDLTDRHPHIKKALAEYRENFSIKNDETSLLEQISSSCRSAINGLKKIKKAAAETSNPYLERNVGIRLDFAEVLINEIASINELSHKEMKKWLLQNIDVDGKIGARILGSKTSPLKAETARQNGKKGGRPSSKEKAEDKKSAAKKSTASSKKTAVKAKADAKTKTASAKSKTAAAKTKTASAKSKAAAKTKSTAKAKAKTKTSKK